MFGQSWRISVLAVEGLRDVELSERDSHLFVLRYQGEGPGFIPRGVGRVTERAILLSETAYFLSSTIFAGHAVQA